MIRLAVLGCGNMGSAIVLGLSRCQSKKSGKFSFFIFTPSHMRAAKLARAVGGRAVRNIADLKNSDYFLIACKPQQFKCLAMELKKHVSNHSKIISVMAGISVDRIKKALGAKKVARVMPNTPCLIGCGTAALYFSGMNAMEQKIVGEIFSALAHVYIVNSEDAMDAATAIVGSGPGLVFEIARILSAKSAGFGFPKNIAGSIVKDVIFGAASLMLQSKASPEELRNRVTSKKGSTAAALKIFKKFHLEKIFERAMQAAYQRAKDLSGS